MNPQAPNYARDSSSLQKEYQKDRKKCIETMLGKSSPACSISSQMLTDHFTTNLAKPSTQQDQSCIKVVEEWIPESRWWRFRDGRLLIGGGAISSEPSRFSSWSR